MTRKRILLIADVRGWAFDVNNKAMAKHVFSDHDVDFFYVEDLVKTGRPDWNAYDLIFAAYHDWKQLPGIPRDKHFSSLRSQWFSLWEPRPKAPTIQEIDLVNGYAGFYVVNESAYEMIHPYCPQVQCLTNPVDFDLFQDVSSRIPNDKIVVQWNGNASHNSGRVKGIDLVTMACAMAGVELKVREYGLNRIPHEDMPDHYAQANVTICASTQEGASNSVLEAMACGHVLISTDCGNVMEMFKKQSEAYGNSGIIVGQRSADDICRILNRLSKEPSDYRRDLGEINRKSIRDFWSWESWAPRFKKFFFGESKSDPVVCPPPKVRRRSVQDLLLYADTPGWAQHIYVEQLGRAAKKWDGVETVHVTTDVPTLEPPTGITIYSPVACAADSFFDRWHYRDICALSGLWSHVSYGGWFTDDPLDPERLPKVPAHATNLYLHALTGLPYLAGGVDTDLFCPPTGSESRINRHKRDPRIVVGWTGSLQYNAAVKLFADLWLPAVRASGSDGHLREAKICARPLVVWDCRDARTPAQVAEYLKGVDIYLCTSISEGCSNSVLEAAASGCAVISTPCGNAPEIANEIVPWNITSIAQVIGYFEKNRWDLYNRQESTRDRMVQCWSWNSKIKNESWKAWLGNGDIPSIEDQIPYRTTFSPKQWLEHSRGLREKSDLVRGNMMGS